MTASFSDLAAKRLTLRACEIGVRVDYECIRADQLRIDFCRGCESCFREGVCPLDRCDGLGMLKQKMLEADVLFFCSPVYTGSLSGAAKTVIDRLGYWTHREELAGKTAAALVTTSHSRGSQTAEQLAFALRAMGAAVAYAGSVSCHSGPVNFYLPNQLEPELDRICERLLDCRRDPSAYIPANTPSCGTVYGSKVWHSTDRYRRVIWQCNNKYGGEYKCATPHLSEQQIQDAFCRAINPLLTDRVRIIGDLEAVKEGLCDDADLIEKQEKLAAEMEVLEGLMHKAIMVNAETAQDQEEYNKCYDGYAAKHEKLKRQYGDAQAEREARQNKAQILASMIDGLSSAVAVITEFDGKLWNATVDHVTVNRESSLVFTMRDSREITVKI